MQIFREIGPLRAFLVEKKAHGKTVGLVPTMGALHKGHMALIKASQAENSLTVCSIYVNPTQFNNPEDLKKYPRPIEQDLEILRQANCDVVFFPENEAMYHSPTLLKFDFGHLDKVMEGEFRPGHFSGVALVVSKLFHIVEPTRAYFGQKDWQQFAIIRQLVSELQFNLELRSIPIVREEDGLAMSSRNVRLTPAQRQKSVIINKVLVDAKTRLQRKESIQQVKSIVQQAIKDDAELRLEYFEVADAQNLKLLTSVEESSQPILCIAVFVGEIRLIDNMFL